MILFLFLLLISGDIVISKESNECPNNLAFSKKLNQCPNSLVVSKKPNDCFRAAVYEHLFVKEPIDKPLEVLKNNLAIFERVIKKASKNSANIIVFPEYALVHEISREDTLAEGIASIIPSLNVNLCEESKNKKNKATNKIEKIADKIIVNRFLLKRLSCAARKNNIYVAVNLFEMTKNLNKTDNFLNFQDQDYLLYNVNVVFDNHGN